MRIYRSSSGLINIFGVRLRAVSVSELYFVSGTDQIGDEEEVILTIVTTVVGLGPGPGRGASSGQHSSEQSRDNGSKCLAPQLADHPVLRLSPCHLSWTSRIDAFNYSLLN